jgi:hypothetical protein
MSFVKLFSQLTEVKGEICGVLISYFCLEISDQFSTG